MYNRYVPQNDGTYSRRTVPEPPGPPQKPQSPPSPSGPQPSQPPPPRPCRKEPSQSLGSFLKQLLPGDFSAEDLLVVLLLLLMASDCPREQNFPLLTLVLYLFL